MFYKFVYPPTLLGQYLMTVLVSACVDTFMKTANNNRAGGQLATGISTLASCEAECLKTAKTDPKPCYGYDFNNGDKTCYLHISQIASTTNPFPNVDAYKRQFVCSQVTTVGKFSTSYLFLASRVRE